MKAKVSLFTLLALSLLISGCATIQSIGKAQPTNTPVPTVQANAAVVSESHLAPRDFKYLSFAGSGNVSEILVKKGDVVSQGQVLARLGDRQQAEATITAAKLEQVTAQQAYDDLNRLAGAATATAWQNLIDAKNAALDAQIAWDNANTTDVQKSIDDAATEVSDRKKDLNNAQDDFDPYKDLSPDNTQRKSYLNSLNTAQKNYDEAVKKHDNLVNQRDLAQAKLDQAQANQAEAQRKYDGAQNGPDPDQLDLAKARLDNANAQIAAAQSALDHMEIKAPFAGSVADINVTENQQVSPTDWAILIADTSQWYVETNDLTELDVVKVKSGQNVSVTADAIPGLALNGKVTEISQVSGQKGGDITYKVRILLDQSPDHPLDSRLRWGMTMESTFGSSVEAQN